ncbi:MAG: 2-enoyl thioester reductase domain-containing protein [Chthoniobacteraceae bacterium]
MKTTRAVVIAAAGQVQCQEIALPLLGHEDVLVRMVAAPIHPADLNSIEGKYPGAPKPPYVGGREGAGVVEEIGAEVATLNPGDLVLLPSAGGAWRERGVHHAADLVPVPKIIHPLQAALLRINPGTALRMLRDFVPLLPGEWLAQNAGNSAVGRAVIQLAHYFGWHTLNLVRDLDAVDPDVLKIGDIFLADDGSSDAPPLLHAPRLAFNAVGGESALRLANALSEGGTLVTYGAMARRPVKLPNSLLIFRDLHARGFWLTRWSGHASPSTQQAMLAELIGLAVAGVLRSHIETTYPLEAFADALAHAARPRRQGKILFGPAS